jgi:hypothetical protein
MVSELFQSFEFIVVSPENPTSIGELPEQDRPVVLKALAKDPVQRYPEHEVILTQAS